MLKEYWIDGEPSTKNEFETIFRIQVQSAYYAYFDQSIDDRFKAIPSDCFPDGWEALSVSSIMRNINREKYVKEQVQYSVEQARDYINTMFMFPNFDLTVNKIHFQYKETEEQTDAINDL